MPGCLPPRCLRCMTKRWPRVLTNGAASRRRRSPKHRSPETPEMSAAKSSALAPGATIGILGGGQLGRMLALDAARLGLKCHIYCPDTGPAFDVSAAHTIAAYEDEAALAEFAGKVDLVTYEFENVPARTAEVIAGLKPLYPDARALAITQDRLKEKAFLRETGIPIADFAEVNTVADLESAVRTL